MSFKAFLSEVEKGLPKPFYLFSAEDPFLQREAIEAIKRLVPETERDFNLHVFDLSPSGDVNLSFGEITQCRKYRLFFRRQEIYHSHRKYPETSEKRIGEIERLRLEPG